ncbi:50S ribosomal protein L23 [Candidatus Nardonella dryophthoridicola]|uniref:50S ribosomal protein L23 n=1 Tax=endosymbiont of Rhynchophorus ferrugineus TaxID=1972133 RepID=A0A2Z5TH17_9GAMM|nr:50S ribosomal protein L23 [Candidatus Nardonella dryophthoridicola]QTJ62849.1 50S ribosomal protein L23 [Candidatus Nardonella dryophthoridicola]BBA85093.1 50S ribosomal protein L23 [endosymbiont of Rhynchophorus ferrugineus]
MNFIKNNRILFDVLKKICLSSKTTYLFNNQKIISYKIYYNINKNFVKLAFKNIFNIYIKKVNIVNYKIYKKGKFIKFKKAYIFLK